MAKNALYDRLQWVRQVYTCLFRMHNDGHTCFDPLFFHYPTLDEAFKDPEHTFIVADALKVSPVLEEKVTKIKSFFPPGRWVSLKDYSILDVKKPEGETIELDAPADAAINVHLMPGKIVMYQDNTDHSKLLTKDLLETRKVSLIMNRDETKHAEGYVFLDDGATLSSLKY